MQSHRKTFALNESESHLRFIRTPRICTRTPKAETGDQGRSRTIRPISRLCVLTWILTDAFSRSEIMAGQPFTTAHACVAGRFGLSYRSRLKLHVSRCGSQTGGGWFQCRYMWTAVVGMCENVLLVLTDSGAITLVRPFCTSMVAFMDCSRMNIQKEQPQTCPRGPIRTIANSSISLIAGDRALSRRPQKSRRSPFKPFAICSVTSMFEWQ
jgi:hypothetical protein